MTQLRDPFNPKTGEFADNIRAEIGKDDGELRASLKEFGWRKEFPAYKDERGVILVGHRRLKIAAQLGIKPVIIELELGIGDEADAERLKIALASNIGFAPMTAADRKHIAEYLYGDRDWTMQRIAKALNVSQSTITEDLRNLSTADKSKHAKTASNPKGSGRPKGSAKRQRRTTQQTEDTAAALVLDQGMTLEQAAAQTGLTSVQQVKTSVAREEGRREAKAGPDIDRVLLSMTAQEKLDAAIRQAKKRLELEFSESVRREVMRDLNEVTLPHYLDKIVKLERLIYARRGVMDKITYNKIRWCLHSDHVQDPAMKRRYDEAFTIFNGLEKLLLDEKHSPTPFRKDLPKTYADLMAARNKVREERRAGAAARRAGKTRVAERF